MLSVVGFCLALLDFTNKSEVLERILDRASVALEGFVEKQIRDYRIYARKISTFIRTSAKSAFSFISGYVKDPALRAGMALNICMFLSFFGCMAGCMAADDIIHGRPVLPFVEFRWWLLTAFGVIPLIVAFGFTVLIAAPFLLLSMGSIVVFAMLLGLDLLRRLVRLLNYPSKGIVGSIGLLLAAIDLIV